MAAHVLDPYRRDVPLREDDERRAVRFARHIGNGKVLLDNALRSVDQDEGNVGALGGVERAQLAVVLDPLPVAPFATQAGSVDEDERAIPALQHRVDRVSRRAGDLADDDALPAEELVEEARLADVGPSED